jgi:hypothetical protein
MGISGYEIESATLAHQRVARLPLAVMTGCDTMGAQSARGRLSRLL